MASRVRVEVEFPDRRELGSSALIVQLDLGKPGQMEKQLKRQLPGVIGNLGLQNVPGTAKVQLQDVITGGTQASPLIGALPDGLRNTSYTVSLG